MLFQRCNQGGTFMDRGHERPSLITKLRGRPSVGELQKEIEQLKNRNSKLQIEKNELEKENIRISKENEFLRKPWDELEKQLRGALNEEARSAIEFRKSVQSAIPTGGWD